VRRIGKALLLTAALVAGSATRVAAEPILQLGIIGGTYDEDSETIISNGDAFQLVALLTTDGQSALLQDTYYISVAITPQLVQSTPGPVLGSFSFEGQTVQATSGMTFGIPPADDYTQPNDADLSPHGVFPTYYTEFEFAFDPLNQITTYNTENNPGQDPALLSNPTGGTYYSLFTVNTSSLQVPYELHFDLYNTEVRREAACRTRQGVTTCLAADIDTGINAPFSHDAESSPGDPAPVPEPATLLMMASGLAISARQIRKSRSRAQSSTSGH
jgi:hypothetical protein